MSWVLIGDGSLAGRTCRQLTAEGHEVHHLRRAGDRELARALNLKIDAVAVLLHDDTEAIRYVLTVEHPRPGLRFYVAMFDRTAAGQMRAVVPNITIISPADAVLPTLLGAVMGSDVLAVGPAVEGEPDRHRSAIRRTSDGLAVQPFNCPDRMRRAGLWGRIRGQLLPHEGSSAILLTGLLGMVAIILVDTFLPMAFKHKGWLTAASEAVAVLSTVGPAPQAEEYPWYQVFTIIAMLAAIIFLAVFTAGTVEHLLSGRYVGWWAVGSCPAPATWWSSGWDRWASGCVRSCASRGLP